MNWQSAQPKQMPEKVLAGIIAKCIVAKQQGEKGTAEAKKKKKYSMDDTKYCQVAAAPLGIYTGSAVAKNATITGISYGGFLVADILSSPHIYAEAETTIYAKISASRFVPLPVCSEPSCKNLSLDS